MPLYLPASTGVAAMLDADFSSWPWTFEQGQKSPHHLSVYGSRGQSICTIWTRDQPQRGANLHLIVTAPELYSQLAKAAKLLNGMGINTPETDALLAKARGERG